MAEDRRAGERRGDERRAFRTEEGRRDPEQNRRRGLRRFLLPALLIAIPLIIGLAWRTAMVAPKRAAAARATEAKSAVLAVVAETRLPMLMLPGSPPPAPDAAPADPLPAPSPEVAPLLADVHDRLSPSLRAAPTVAVVPGVLGPARFLAGNERGARKAWESLLAVGAAEDRTTAHVGLGVVALRVAARLPEGADRTFALGEAMRHLDATAGTSDAAVFDRAVALALQGDSDAATAQAAALPAPLREVLAGWIERGAPPANLTEGTE